MFSDRLDRILDVAVVPGYTRLGYAARRLPPITSSMDGRTVVITGATSGLGRASAEQLAALGARLVLVGRNPQKAGAAVEEIVAATGNPDVAYELADLGSMAQTRDLASRLLVGYDEIHVLVNNAGVLFGERAETEEGIERTLATNLLSHFLLTNLLIPRLIASAPARIINVSSGGMYTQRVRVRDLQWERHPWNGSAAYARTKRGQVILTEMWAERLAGTGVVVHAMHPGWADTPGVASSLPAFRRITGALLRTPEQGADTIVWLAAAPEAAESSGLFWHDRRPRPTHRTQRTVESAEDRDELWRRLSELSGWDENEAGGRSSD